MSKSVQTVDMEKVEAIAKAVSDSIGRSEIIQIATHLFAAKSSRNLETAKVSVMEAELLQGMVNKTLGPPVNLEPILDAMKPKGGPKKPSTTKKPGATKKKKLDA